MTEEQLSALLRLKRHEQPPPGYFDELLRSVHRRQREELLQRPLWRIAVERWQTFFSEHSMGTASYVGAMASVLLMGVIGVGVLTSGERVAAPGGAVAENSNRQPAMQLSLARPTPGPSGGQQIAAADFAPPSLAPANGPQQRYVPRYVIDARPVSYAQSFNF